MKTIVCIISLLFSSFCLASNDYPVFTYTINDAIIESQATKKDVLLIFTADWCKYCQNLKKDIDKNPSSLNGLVVSYINVDEYPELAKRYKIKKLPECIIIRDTLEIKRKTGYKNIEDMKKWIKDVR